MTDKKRSIIDLMQRLSPFHRKKVSLINDLTKMDNALLVERIRHMTHHLDLIIKFEWREKKGQDLRERLEAFLQEYTTRGLPKDATIDWSNTILKKYYLWYDQKKPQISKSVISRHEDFWRLILQRRSIRKWISK